MLKQSACKALFIASVIASACVQAVPLEEAQFISMDGTLLKAWLALPSAANTAKPTATVVALHGCGGLYATSGPRQGLLNARHQAMADRLVGEGYAVVFPDSLTSRGVRELCTQTIGSRSITQRERRRDALAALNWVRQQPWGQTGEVALLGWSHGGSAVLAATDANQPEVAAQKNSFKTAIAFYPGCAAAVKSGYQPNTTLTMLVGEKDDWTPAAPCIALGKTTGASVTVYPDSYHDFDNPVGTVRLRTDVPNGVNPGQGVHVGANPVAREAANTEVLSRLKAAFNSP